MEVVILAGGLGTRMAVTHPGVPKALLPVGGTPILDLNLAWLVSQGFTEFSICVGFLAEVIEQHITGLRHREVRIRISREPRAGGTAGALRHLDPPPERSFLVIYGDVLAFTDFSRFAESHVRQGADATLLIHPSTHPADSDLVEIDNNDQVTALHPKPNKSEKPPGLGNAAVFALEPKVIDLVRPDVPEDIFQDLLPRVMQQGGRVQAVPNLGFVRDLGTPDRLTEATRVVNEPDYFERLTRPRKPFVFLDRDGVLVQERPHIARVEDLRVLPGAIQAVKKLNLAGFPTIVLTNQPVVARGDISEEELRSMHRHLQAEFLDGGAWLQRIFYCPHHPDSGFPGERSSLKVRCSCRKPSTGLFDRAIAEFPVDPSPSFMVGDSRADQLMAERAGITPLLIKSSRWRDEGTFNSSLAEPLIFENLQQVADYIVDFLPKVRPIAALLHRQQTVCIEAADVQARTLLTHGLEYWWKLGRQTVTRVPAGQLDPHANLASVAWAANARPRVLPPKAMGHFIVEPNSEEAQGNDVLHLRIRDLRLGPQGVLSIDPPITENHA